MNIANNQVKAVIAYMRRALNAYYEREEIENFILLGFKQFAGFTRMDLILKANSYLSESTLIQFIKLVKGLKAFQPIQYLLGNTEFYGIPLHVNQNVLIPRQETEELVDWIIKETRKKEREIAKNEFTLLDIGTGSGCIAISLKKHMTFCRIYALDISEKALAAAKENARQNKTEIIFIHYDILTPIIAPSPVKYDIIVSNPPYVTYAEQTSMAKNVLEHEPRLALFVEEEKPLKFYEAIANFAQVNLKNKGYLYLEINEAFGKQAVDLLQKKGFSNVELRKDLSGKDRMIRAQLTINC